MLIQTPEIDRFESRRVGVVVACRGEDGLWLMMRRGAGVSRAPLRVGFPGGEVEAGETQEEAIVREVKEEVGLDVVPKLCVWKCTLGDRPWVLYGWYAEIVGGELVPDAIEVEEVLWLSDEEGANHVDGLPTNGDFLGALAKYVKI